MKWTRLNGSRIPQDTVAAIRATRDGGASLRKIADLYGLDQGTVGRIVSNPDFGRLVAPEVERAIRKAVADGLGISATARRYRIDVRTVTRAAALLGILMPDGRTGRRKVKPEEIDTSISWAENARRLGVAVGAVRYCAKVSGIKRAPYRTVLSLLSRDERQSYDRVRTAMNVARSKSEPGQKRRDILKAIGRGDLVECVL